MKVISNMVNHKSLEHSQVISKGFDSTFYINCQAPQIMLVDICET